MKKVIMFGLLATCVASTSAQFASAGATEEGRSQFTPWSGYWWPHARGEILGPLVKYDQLTGKVAAKWENDHHPPGPDVPRWHGYCHAWAASALMEAEPVTAITARMASMQLELGVADQKGLLAASHGQDIANSYGDRFGDRQGTDDPQDLLPDQLWHLLKLYVKQQGVPLVLDVEAAAEVWNYPIYAYRVTYSPKGTEGEHLANMTIWMADDAVPPEFVGVKVRRQSYQFSFKMRNGAVVMGTGKWVGPSIKDHPDFAWYPYVALPENPEIDYQLVRNLLGLGPVVSTSPVAVNVESPLQPEAEVTPAISSPTVPMPSTPSTVSPPDSPPVNATIDPDNPPAPLAAGASRPETPSIPPRFDDSRPQTPDSRPNPGNRPAPSRPAPDNRQPSAVASDNPNPNEVSAERVIVISPWELVALIANKTSSFAMDVTADRFDGGHYAVGESYSLRVSSERNGFLYLLHIDPQGGLSLLYPQPGQPNRIAAGNAVVIPNPTDAWIFKTTRPVGQNRIKAVVTRRPLVLSGLWTGDSGSTQRPVREVSPQQKRAVPRLQFRWHPTQRQSIQELLLGYQQSHAIDPADFGGLNPQQVVGEFSQDEVAFYVGLAADDRGNPAPAVKREKQSTPKK